MAKRRASGWAGPAEVCVFFAQQSVENRLKGLWEGRFFIARQASFVNVCDATEGGIPLLRFPGRRIAPSDTPSAV
jgi:hypothetical protein